MDTLNAPRFNLDDPELHRDPYKVYRYLRSQPGMARGGPGQWVVTRYDEVKELLRDPRLGREFPDEYQSLSVGDGPANDFLRRIIIDRDPEEHTRVRRLLSKAMQPRTVRHLQGPVADLVDRFLAPALEGDGRFDAVRDLAQPLPVEVMSDMFDIPAADRRMIEQWSTALAKAFAVFIPDEDRRRAHEAVEHLRGYVSDLADHRRRHPGDDLLSRMLDVTDRGQRLSNEEIIDNALFIYYAGYETTTNLLATGCAAMVEEPTILGDLRGDPDLVPRAMEEFLRWDAPIHTTTRLVNETVQVKDEKLRPGRVVVIVLAAANHDENKFENADQIDIHRHPNPHVSFGGGIHHCLGAAIARVETRAVFERLSQTLTRMESADEMVWRPSGGGFRFPYCAYESIPVRVTAV